LRYLVTGGAGFIGSHLCDALSARGEEVVILDDLCTGTLDNVDHLLRSGRAEFIHGSVLDDDLVPELLDATDSCVHLASAVGVKLVVGQPVDTLLRNVRGSDVVLSAAAALKRPVMFASTSEVYGKNDGAGLSEGSNRTYGATWKSRWNYATSKSFGEALALGYHQELGAQNTVVRFFNTVGPRQTGAYGMVLPSFVRQALTGCELTVYGDGRQTRCFGHVYDTVDAVMGLLDYNRAPGGVYNIGSDEEISILDLARAVIARSDSAAGIRLVPYHEAYGEGFEELGRRRPDTSALRELTGWSPTRTIDDAIDDMIGFERRLAAAPQAMNGYHQANGDRSREGGLKIAR
jgi:UDP-glucose 4-epimerase